MLVRVVAAHFVAGFVYDDGVKECAPILRKAFMGKTQEQIREISRNRGWKASIVKDAA